MMYYNYLPYYYPPLKHYPNKVYQNSRSPKIPKATMINTNSNNKNRLKPPTKIENTTASKDDDSIFEIFGIKLYFDDILLICLIFFLYNEGVQDQYLFVALILLLLS